MTRPNSGPPRQRPAPLRAEVLRRKQLTPALVRVTVTGPEFDRFRWVGPAAHFKLLLPEPGAADVVLPARASDGSITPGSARPTIRTYTARRFDAATGELDIDIALHGHGPAAAWAASVAPGARLAVSMPRAAGFIEDPAADWLLLAGDISALPAIATIADTITKPAHVLIELDDRADRVEIGLPVEWLDSPPVGPGLQAAIAEVARPPGRGQVWIAAEAGLIRRIRTDLLANLTAEQVTTRGYWRAGAPNHPDHDYGDDA